MDDSVDTARKAVVELLPRGLQTVHLAHEPGFVAGFAVSSPLPDPRLILSLRGERIHSYVAEGQVRPVGLSPYEALWVNPDCCIGTAYERNNEAFVVIFRKDTTRILRIKYRCGRDPERTMRANPIVALELEGTVDHVGRQYIEALNSASSYAPDYAVGLATCLLHKVVDFLDAASVPRLTRAEHTWHRLLAYLNENYREPIQRVDAARFLGIHENHVSRLFAAFGSETFRQRLARMRLEDAVRLLENTDLPVKGIATQCGFESANYFIRVFRKHFGLSPHRYRQQHFRG